MGRGCSQHFVGNAHACVSLMVLLVLSTAALDILRSKGLPFVTYFLIRRFSMVCVFRALVAYRKPSPDALDRRCRGSLSLRCLDGVVDVFEAAVSLFFDGEDEVRMDGTSGKK